MASFLPASSLALVPSLKPHPKQPETLTPTLASSEQHLLSSLRSLRSPSDLPALHAVALKTGLAHRSPVLSHLILLSPSPSSSLLLLRSLSSPPDSPVPFNLALSSLSRSASHLSALLTYSILRSLSVPIDPSTLPPVLRSAASLSSLSAGLDAHALAVKTGIAARLPTATALIRFYFAVGLPARSLCIFDRCHSRDTVLWNTTLVGFVRCGKFDVARKLFNEMPHRLRNTASWNTMIDFYCSKIGNVLIARKVFDEMPKRDIVSWNAMISGYVRIGDCETARELFDVMPVKDLISWNAMIAGYVRNGFFSEALNLFRRMQGTVGGEVRPDEVTVTVVLPACARLGSLDLGRWIHCYIRSKRIKMDLKMATALVDMYGRCGSIEDAQKMFDETTQRDAFLYGTMIEVLAMHGMADEAFKLFESMRGEGIKPNDITITGLLKACAHKGLVETGLRLFSAMEESFLLSPKQEHYGCMVDLLGRAGKLEDAHELILKMTMEMGPSPVLWSSLLSACRVHGDLKLAEEVGRRVIELEPGGCGNYVLLSNIYSMAKQWEDAVATRKKMKEKGVVKKPGCSSMEVRNQIFEFFAGDRNHPQRREIYEMLHGMAAKLEQFGYEEEERKARGVMYHSEKLALAFGLINTEKGETIRIMKNLRVCDDCHLFIKLASACFCRKVIVRDSHRFHHFSNGLCSCLDYW